MAEKECSSTSCTKESCEGCPSRQQAPKSMLEEQNIFSNIKHVVGVVSGKGGVGKSLGTASLANMMASQGYRVGIMDADITGPSIPKAFGIKNQIVGNGELMFPQTSKKYGIKLISVNLLIDEPTKPVLWRGPVIGGAVKQFYTDVLWEELDFLFIDMPPGTGDVALTVFQSIPVDDVIIVSTPQDLVSMIVGKAVNMCKMMNIPMLGLVENMSYMECPCCAEKHTSRHNTHTCKNKLIKTLKKIFFAL